MNSKYENIKINMRGIGGYLFVFMFLFFTASTGLQAQENCEKQIVKVEECENNDFPMPYVLVDSLGKSVSYLTMMQDLSQNADVVFFGELHNSPIAHWLELRILKSLNNLSANPIKLGMEQFEADNQLIIDEYFAGLITDKKFRDEVRLWSNYSTDYAPVVEFARENKIPLIATNIPRRYANVVSHDGFDVLDGFSDEAKSYMAPLPIPYEKTSMAGPMAEMMAHMGGNMDNLNKAQAMKDATMAWNIAKSFNLHSKKSTQKDSQNAFQKHAQQDSQQEVVSSNLNTKFFHINGSAHSDDFGGIINFLKVYAPGLRVKVIETVYSESISESAFKLPEEEKGSANYFIVLAKDMVTSY